MESEERTADYDRLLYGTLGQTVANHKLTTSYVDTITLVSAFDFNIKAIQCQIKHILNTF